MAGEKIHVIPNPDGGWTVKKDGASRATGKYKTKKEALEKARSLSGNSGGLVIEYSAKGQVQSISKSKKEEKDMSKVKIHVVPNADGGWIVRREGSDRALAKFKTKPEAMERAKALSGNSDAHVVEHSSKGSIMAVSKSKKAEKPKAEKKPAAAKKAAEKKPAKKAAVAKKPATAKKAAEKKPKAEKKPAEKKPVAKKPAAKTATAKKTTEKKVSAKKPVAKKPASKKKCRAAILTSDEMNEEEKPQIKKKREVMTKLSDEEEVVMLAGEPVVIKKSGRRVVIIR